MKDNKNVFKRVSELEATEQQTVRPVIDFPEVEDKNELVAECRKIFETYKAYIDTLDVEQAHEEEKYLMTIMDKWDKDVKNRQYTIANEVKYNGTVYKKKDIFGYMCDFIDKLEVEYSYTLGLYQAYQFWTHPHNTVDYATLDATLRILGQMKFKGHEQWKRILVINEFLKHCDDAYTNDNAHSVFLATLHNTIIEKLQLQAPLGEQQPGNGLIVD